MTLNHCNIIANYFFLYLDNSAPENSGQCIFFVAYTVFGLGLMFPPVWTLYKPMIQFIQWYQYLSRFFPLYISGEKWLDNIFFSGLKTQYLHVHYLTFFPEIIHCASFSLW